MKKVDITGYKCIKCGKIHYPFHDRCIVCKGREFEELKAEGNARLITYTQIFNLPWGFDQRYIFIGVVEFENCIKAMGQIKATSANMLKTGMILKPTWEPVRTISGEKFYGLVLEPAE